MPYLEQFWKSLCGTFLWLDWVPRSVSPGERISRFILRKGYFDQSKGWVSSAAFTPSGKTTDISVYRTSRCSGNRLWLIGRVFVERKRDKRIILARADFDSALALQEGLKIIARLLPHPRHADLTNWPDDKPLQKMKALALAEGSALHLHPTRKPFY